MKYFPIIMAVLSACQFEPRKSQINNPPLTPAVINADSIPCPLSMLENTTDTIPPNLYGPKIRYSFCNWWMPEDTITPNGNFINYLISNDTCCRDYLYLAWGNKHFRRLENLGPLRQFHPKMIPRYAGETHQYLFLEGAANGGFPITGWLLWAFPLAPNEAGYQWYSTLDVDAYDLKSMTLLREVEENPTDNLQIEAYNIRTKRVKPIQLPKQIRKNASSDWSIDSISITPQTIFLQLGGYDKEGREIKERLLLPNDIK